MATFVDDFGVAEFEHIADPAGSLWAAFQVAAQPSFVFIDDDGEIRRHIGGLTDDELLHQVQLLLAV